MEDYRHRWSEAKEVKVTEETHLRNWNNIIYVLALFGSGQLKADDTENYGLFWNCVFWEEIYLYSIVSLVMFRVEQDLGRSQVKRIAGSVYNFVIATHCYFQLYYHN